MSKIVYLAGGMHSTWRDQVQLPEGSSLDPMSWSCDDPKEYTRLDLEAIDRSDVVIAYMDSANPSGFGMSVEVGYAYAKGKRVLFVDHIKNDWRSRYFGMHRSMSEVFNSIEEAVAAL